MPPHQSVETVSRLWYARFVAAGVDALDLNRLLETVESWDTWQSAWLALADRYEGLARHARSAGHDLTAGEFLQIAAMAVHFSRIAGDEEETLRERYVRLYRQAAPLLAPPAEPVLIDSEAGAVPGYLRVPKEASRCGVVLLMPGLDSVKEQLGAWEPYFLARGMATLSIEGPGQGESANRIFSVADYRVAVAAVGRYIAESDRMDPARVVAAGVSLGGHIVLQTAPTLASIVGLRGVVDFGGRWDLAENFADRPAVIREGFKRLIGAVQDEDVARILEDASLGQVLGQIDVPVLVAHGGRDPIVPVEDAYRVARELGSLATLYIEEDGNHNINDYHVISRRVVADWAADRISAD